MGDERHVRGRYLNFPCADGYAYYEIIRKNKKTVRIRVITEIGDNWVVPYIGEENAVDQELALSNIGLRDFLAGSIRKRN